MQILLCNIHKWGLQMRIELIKHKSWLFTNGQAL